MQVGRVALAILLLQDFVVVPLLVIVLILGSGAGVESLPMILGNSMLKAVLALGVIFITGRVEKIVEIEFNDKEKAAFSKSVDSVKGLINSIKM